MPGSSTHVAVRLVLAAKQAVSRVEAAMVDSLNVRRESSDAATLAAVGAGETAELHFVVIAVSPIPLRMRGNLTFLVCFRRMLPVAAVRYAHRSTASPATCDRASSISRCPCLLRASSPRSRARRFACSLFP